MKVILASSSPRRFQLLTTLGFEVLVMVPDVDEVQLAGESPQDMVVRLARLKANSVKTELNLSDLPIIAADTIVCLGDLVLGKPKNNNDAIEMLTRLSGKEHTVITGYAVKMRQHEKVGYEASKVFFRELSEAEILAYVRCGESLDKAGAYAIQGAGASLIDEVKGNYTNVIGLPVNKILTVLKDMTKADL